MYAAGAKGDSAPIQRIAGPGTRLIDVEGLAIDSDDDIYVVDALDRHDFVSVFAAGSNGEVPPVRTIGGSKTGLVVPWGIALDATGTSMSQTNIRARAKAALRSTQRGLAATSPRSRR